MALIAVGGGKGGVGRTLVATGLAVFLAQLGRKVLLVDAHAHGLSLGSLFPLAGPAGGGEDRGLEGSSAREAWGVPALARDPKGAETTVPNVRLLAATTELGAVPGVPLRRPRELAQAGGAEHTVLDLGPGVGATALAAALDADAALLVTTPEPASVAAFHRWIRHAFARSLSRALRGRPPELDAVEKLERAHGGPPAPRALAAHIAAMGPTAASLAWECLARFRAYLVVNGSRSRADLELGEALTVVARQRHGVLVEYLGHVEYDDAVSLAARRQRPLLVDAPGAKASRNLERVARRLLSLEAARAERAAHPNAHVPSGDGAPHAPVEPTHYDVLGLERGASDEEIRRSARRMRDLYGAGSLSVVGLLGPVELASMQARVDLARDVLLDPSQRRPYDLSIMQPEELYSLASSEVRPAVSPEGPLEPLPELTPDTEFSGALLRAVREARGIELRDVAARTKISLANLRAIEQEDFAALPALVYVRGFMGELARVLKLDVEQVLRTYLRRYRRATELPSGRPRGG